MKLPQFLRDVKLKQDDAARLSEVMRNWLTIHAHIRRQSPTPEGVEELRKMLVYELEGQRRLHILTRLRSRFNSLRIKNEDRQLLEES